MKLSESEKREIYRKATSVASIKADEFMTPEKYKLAEQIAQRDKEVFPNMDETRTVHFEGGLSVQLAHPALVAYTYAYQEFLDEEIEKLTKQRLDEKSKLGLRGLLERLHNQLSA